MLGHELVSRLAPSHDVTATSRESVDALRFETVNRALAEVEPEAVVNTIGVIKQNIDSDQEGYAREINAEFPLTAHTVPVLPR